LGEICSVLRKELRVGPGTLIHRRNGVGRRSHIISSGGPKFFRYGMYERLGCLLRGRRKSRAYAGTQGKAKKNRSYKRTGWLKLLIETVSSKQLTSPPTPTIEDHPAKGSEGLGWESRRKSGTESLALRNLRWLQNIKNSPIQELSAPAGRKGGGKRKARLVSPGPRQLASQSGCCLGGHFKDGNARQQE